MRTLITAAVLLILPSAALACSLCSSIARRESISQQFDRARVVIYGKLANPRANISPNTLPDGTGTTEFHVEKVLKSDTPLSDAKMHVLPRYLPVLNPKDPPRYLMFFEVNAGRLDAFDGRHLHTPALLDYLQGLRGISASDRVARLVYAAGHFDHGDAGVADEAFLFFAQGNDAEVAKAATQLNPEKLRKLIAQPGLEPERLSLYAYLLGACGGRDDAERLRALAEKRDETTTKALEGILAGYVALRSEDGWKLTHAVLANVKEPFLRRYAAVRTLRFYANSRPVETRTEVLHGVALMLAQGELADMAINDLRTRKCWDLTPTIFALWGRTSHDSPIVTNSIVRYGLVCPRPEARDFVARVRTQDPRLVRDLEEDLEIIERK